MTGYKEKQTLAVFDFDGTITTKDTMFDFISFYHSKSKLILGLCILSPILILYKIGVISNSSAKQKLLAFFFKGEKEEYFDKRCREYASKINLIVRPKAIDKIKQHQAEGHLVIIDSASIDKWIEPWAKSIGINIVIATKLEVKNGIFNGRLASKNCYGKEKVNRLLELFSGENIYKMYAYGDSRGDKELLKIADHSFYREFE